MKFLLLFILNDQKKVTCAEKQLMVPKNEQKFMWLVIRIPSLMYFKVLDGTKHVHQSHSIIFSEISTKRRGVVGKLELLSAFSEVSMTWLGQIEERAFPLLHSTEQKKKLRHSSKPLHWGVGLARVLRKFSEPDVRSTTHHFPELEWANVARSK